MKKMKRRTRMKKMMVMKEKNRIHRMKTQIAALMDLANLKSLMNSNSNLNLMSSMNWKSLTHSGN